MEQTLLFLINRQWTSPETDWLMAITTDWNFWRPIILSVGILFGIFGGFHARAALLCTLVCLGIVDPIVVNSIKHAVGRPRPYMMLQGVREVKLAHAQPQILALAKPLTIEYSQPSIEPIRGPSFPSGHAANNFTVATVFTLFFRRWGWILMIPSALVAYSRVYVGVHWPLDILAASLIGAGVALVLTILIEWAWRRWGERVFPKLANAHPSLFAPT